MSETRQVVYMTFADKKFMLPWRLSLGLYLRYVKGFSFAGRIAW